ncbi:MAG: formyltransferase family protein [Collinsella intestinalis]
MSSKDEQSLAAAVAEVTAAARVSGMPDINELQDARAACSRIARRCPSACCFLVPAPICRRSSTPSSVRSTPRSACCGHALCFGLKRAEAAGIQTLTLSKEIYADPIQADEVIAHELLAAGCECVVMAGYMRMVHAPLPPRSQPRDQHPSCAPAQFPGAHGIRVVPDCGVKVTAPCISPTPCTTWSDHRSALLVVEEDWVDS